jgi:60 kDa SS-A/Ro ribonucleoprotein
VLRLAETDPRLVVDEIVAISTAGRAPKQNPALFENPALFALAAVVGMADAAGRAYALEHLGQLARTGTHLALFTSYVQRFRGWGRQLRRAIGNWYLGKTPDALAYQVLKYRLRGGWRHRDLLRKAHPKTTDAAKARLFDYIAHLHRARDLETGKTPDLNGLPDLVGAFEAARTADRATLVALIGRHPLSWEMLPNEALDWADVWAALLDQGMPITEQLVLQLPRLTRLGLLSGARGGEVAERLADPAVQRQERIHPISMQVALRTYASVQGEWKPVRQIVDALDAGFYAAFRAVEPTGKRLLLALDVSGSMTAQISDLPLSAREASAALALVTAATEAEYEILGFTAQGPDAVRGKMPLGHSFYPRPYVSRLAISPRQRLDDVLKTIGGLPFSGTDCALPMRWATKHKVKVDAFIVYTGDKARAVEPHQALQRYRETMGIPAKLIVVGMTTRFVSIADPNDAGMLDIAGFNTAVPNFIADFARYATGMSAGRTGT